MLACEYLEVAWFSRLLAWYLYHQSDCSVMEDFFWTNFNQVKFPSMHFLRLISGAEYFASFKSRYTQDISILLGLFVCRWRFCQTPKMKSFVFDGTAQQEHQSQPIWLVDLVRSIDLANVLVLPEVQEWNLSCCHTPNISYAIVRESGVAVEFWWLAIGDIVKAELDGTFLGSFLQYSFLGSSILLL